jgi:ABC-type dipeptide/oligopeptide/nickel transport system ATPase component
MADRIAIMRKGKVVQVASLGVPRSSPVDPYVTQLLTSY